jgi:hypothetical protein
VSNYIRISAIALLFWAATMGTISPVTAQDRGATSFGASQAEIIKPISVTALDDLTFGGIAVTSTQGGSVKVLPETSRAEYTGAAAPVCIGSGRCTANPALFDVRGESNRGYTVAIPSVIYAQSSLLGDPDLPVSDLTSKSRNLPSGRFRGFLDSAGRDEIRIGGTLAIPAGTRPGKYHAEVSVVVTYD